MQCLNFFQQIDSNGQILKTLTQMQQNSLKGSVLEVDFEYPKELRKIHNDYPLAPDKTEIKSCLNVN